MKNLNINLTLFLILLFISCHRSFLSSYIDNTPPTLQPRLFAPGFISTKTQSEFGSVFSKNGREFYYGVDLDGRAEIRHSTLEKGRWTTPRTILSHESYSYNDPFPSPDEDRLFYISDQPRNDQDTIKDYDIWYSQRTAEGWSEPINAGMTINSDAHEYYISFTSAGTMYFASNREHAQERKHDFDIYRSENRSGSFQPPQKLGEAINSRAYEADVFIAPDESYLIFCAARRSGLGRGDLYISFKDDQGEWNAAKSMGAVINTPQHELCPFVTRDGKYLFYTSDQDIYWISAEVIEML